MFCHFGPNTFTGKEWGDGTETEDMFNPSDLDCRQWAATAKAAGFKGIIITAKHHDGFCLWPSPVSSHTVAQSTWRNGQGDVLRELSEACKEYGIKFGVYISPWDRNDPHYGTDAYNDVYVKTLESVLGGAYGPVFEQWLDGANGEGPNGKKQQYDWPLFHGTILRLQPQAVIFSDVGPGCRWVGNEKGRAGRTNWGKLDIEGFTPGHGAPPVDTLNQGNRYGSHWVPAETDVSIRPGWFWKASETPQVKTVQQLLKIYYESVGRNSLLLLNVPPDERGHIDPVDSTRLMEAGSFQPARPAGGPQPRPANRRFHGGGPGGRQVGDRGGRDHRRLQAHCPAPGCDGRCRARPCRRIPCKALPPFHRPVPGRHLPRVA